MFKNNICFDANSCEIPIVLILTLLINKGGQEKNLPNQILLIFWSTFRFLDEIYPRKVEKI
jgi:hypothetical protein